MTAPSVSLLPSDPAVRAFSKPSALISAAKAEIEQEANRAREQLRHQVVGLAIAGAGKILRREVDEAANAALLDDLVAQL